jgi:phosphatidylinositol phospholipase C delta
LSRQLIGVSSAAAYTHVLKHGARCVEIDVWPHPSRDSQSEPIVTHGYTFSKSVPFRDVCEAINDGIDPDGWPVMISLECHVPVAAQQQLVQIMKETWGSKLIEAAIEGVQDNVVSPLDLKGRILLIVGPHFAEDRSIGLLLE